MVVTEIDVLVHKYLQENPSFKYPPSGEKHPSILAMSTQIKPWIIDRLGGIEQYWKAMLRSAKIWFTPGSDSREYKIFCTRFEAEGNTFWEGRPEFEEISKEYLEWRLSKNKTS